MNHPQPVGGLMSADVHCYEQVNKLLKNEKIVSLLKNGTVEISSGVIVNIPNGLKFELKYSKDSIFIYFLDCYPTVTANKFFTLTVKIDYLQITSKRIIVSLDNFPDFELVLK